MQDLYRSVQIFFEDFCRNMFFCSFKGTNIQHFWTSSTTLSSILADLRSVSRNSPSLKIHEKEKLSPSRYFCCLGKISYRSYTNLCISLGISRSGCSTLRGFCAILTSFWQIKFDMSQPSGLVDVLIKCCFNISAT